MSMSSLKHVYCILKLHLKKYLFVLYTEHFLKYSKNRDEVFTSFEESIFISKKVLLKKKKQERKDEYIVTKYTNYLLYCLMNDNEVETHLTEDSKMKKDTTYVALIEI